MSFWEDPFSEWSQGSSRRLFSWPKHYPDSVRILSFSRKRWPINSRLLWFDRFEWTFREITFMRRKRHLIWMIKSMDASVMSIITSSRYLNSYWIFIFGDDNGDARSSRTRRFLQNGRSGNNFMRHSVTQRPIQFHSLIAKQPNAD